MLCLVFTTTLACRPGEGGLLSVLRKRGLKYFFLAIADVEANYLVVQAYQYTTLRSAQLLDCFAIPAVLVLSRTVLKVRYQIIHVIGVKVCLVGIFCLVWAIPDENNETAKDRLIGKVILAFCHLIKHIENVISFGLNRWFDVHRRSTFIWDNYHSRRVHSENNRLRWVFSYDWPLWKCNQWGTAVSLLVLSCKELFRKWKTFFVELLWNMNKLPVLTGQNGEWLPCWQLSHSPYLLTTPLHRS